MTATWEEEYSISWTPETLARGCEFAPKATTKMTTWARTRGLKTRADMACTGPPRGDADKIERESNSRYISKGQMCELRQDGEMRIEDGGGNVDGQSIGFRTDTAASVILSIKVGGDGSAGTPIYASEEVVVPGTGTVLTPVPGKVRLWLQNHVDTGSLLRQTLSACFDVTVEPGEMTTACFDANGHWVLDTN